MASTTIQVKIPQELKQDAEVLLSAMGMTVTEAFQLFLYQTVAENQLPATPKLRKPSKGFKEAIQELDSGQAKHFDSFEDFAASWK